ncbi:MAG: hypothetical protein [Cressdnaviricota sp.]|nr:MAG: hypothetical protein [Cressdnaviricota sp.]
MDLGEICFGVADLYDKLQKALKTRKKTRFFELKAKLKSVQDCLSAKNEPLLENYLSTIQQIQYVGGGNQTFESKWKAITITTDYINNPVDIKDFKNRIDNFLNIKRKRKVDSCRGTPALSGSATTPKFSNWIYTFEHMNTNLHCHIACEFTRRKWPASEFYKDLLDYFPKDQYNIQLKDNKGNWHLMSRNSHRIEGFIYYIIKDEPDKIIYTSNFKKEDLCVNLFTIIFFKLYKERCQEEIPFTESDITDEKSAKYKEHSGEVE